MKSAALALAIVLFIVIAIALGVAWVLFRFVRIR